MKSEAQEAPVIILDGLRFDWPPGTLEQVAQMWTDGVSFADIVEQVNPMHTSDFSSHDDRADEVGLLRPKEAKGGQMNDI